jgi:Tol biopolymer transport system component/DNA-binding winged helix-turn-helix (wHTH) protein
MIEIEPLTVNKITTIADRNRLSIGGKVIDLPPKVVQVWLHLVENQTRTVTRNELIESIWKGNQLVGERALTQVIWQLRKSFKDTGFEDEIIQTIPKIGYRLAGEPTTAKKKSVPVQKYAILSVLVTALLIVISVIATAQYNQFAEPSLAQHLQLTDFSKGETSPDLSFDGRLLAFEAIGARKIPNVYYIDLTDPKKKRISVGQSEHPETSPSWSRDATLLAFIRYRENHFCHVMLFDLKLKAERKVANCGMSILKRVDWSPTNKALAFSACEQDQTTCGIVIYDLDENKQKFVTQRPASVPFIDLFPRWSPGGDKLAFTRINNSFAFGLYTIDVDVLNQERLIEEYECCFNGMDWVSSGEQLILAHGESNNPWLSLVDTEQNVTNSLERSATSALFPSVSIGTNSVAYSTKSISSSIQNVDISSISGSNVKTILNTIGYDKNAHMSADGNWLTFESNKSGKNEIWVSEINGGNQYSVSANLYNVSTPTWNPSGEYIAFLASKEPESPQLVWVYSMEDSTLSLLSTEKRVHSSPSWSKSEPNKLYAAIFQFEHWSVWQFSMHGEKEKVLSHGAVIAKEGYSGDYLYFVSSYATGIWQVPKSNPDSEPKKIVEMNSLLFWHTWDVSPSGIYYVDEYNNNHTIKHHKFGDSSNSIIHEIENSIGYWSRLQAHSNGDVLYSEEGPSTGNIFVARLDEN